MTEERDYLLEFMKHFFLTDVIRSDDCLVYHCGGGKGREAAKYAQSYIELNELPLEAKCNERNGLFIDSFTVTLKPKELVEKPLSDLMRSIK
jgi:hypothetical protein